MKPIKTISFVITGFKFSKLITSISAKMSFVFTYQYGGKICAIAKTLFGNHLAGTNTPHKNEEPTAITFTSPLKAFLLLIRLLKNIAKVKATMVNINEFII